MRNSIAARPVPAWTFMHLLLPVLCGAASASADDGAPLNLVQHFKVAEVHRPANTISVHPDCNWDFFSSGFHMPGANELAEGYMWTKGRCAVIEFPLARKGPARLGLELGTLQRDELSTGGTLKVHVMGQEMEVPAETAMDYGMLPAQDVEVRWNGQTLGTLPVASRRQYFELELPEKWQRLGVNCLELLPLVWLSPSAFAEGLDRRQLGVRFWKASIGGRETPEVTGAGAVVAEDSIRQFPDSTVSFFFASPGPARFRSLLSLHKESGGLPVEPSGQVVISLLDEAGSESELFRKDVNGLEKQDAWTVDGEIPAAKGKMFSLTMAYCANPVSGESAAPSGGTFIEWRNPVVEPVLETAAAAAVPPDLPHKKLNVVIALFDSLRADHLGPYGAAAPHTPVLDQFASEGTVCANAFSNSSFTRTSVASLLSGVYPDTHKTLELQSALPPGVPYLPEELKKAGYRTCFLHKSIHVGAQYGFGRGCDVFQDVTGIDAEAGCVDDAPARRWEILLNRHLAPFVAQGQGEPFFLYLHENDPHAPYTPPPAFDHYAKPEYPGRARGFSNIMSVLMPVNTGALKLEPADIQYYHSQYMGEVELIDTYFGCLLDWLQKNGLADNTVVLFISDHGEAFLEHGCIQHSTNLYQEALGIPMIWRAKGFIPPGARNPSRTEQVDVAPTLLDLLGLGIPPQMQGRSLLRSMVSPDENDPGKPLFAKLGLAASVQDSVRFQNWKLIRRCVGGRKLSTCELYNLDTDPAENFDCWARHFVAGRTLRQMLNWHGITCAEKDSAKKDAAGAGGNTDENQERIRAFGYLK